MILFHGTSSRFLKPILKHGLRPRKLTGRSTYEGHLESNEELVYLTDVYPLQFAAIAIEKHGGNMLIVSVNVPEEKLLPDTDFTEEGTHYLKLKNGSECLAKTGCVSIAEPVKVEMAWVIPKKLQKEFKNCSTRIATSIRHKGFYKIHQEQLSYFLQMGKRYRNRDGIWTDELDRVICELSRE